MSLYDNITMTGLIKRPFRVLSNTYFAFISGPKAGKPFKVKFESSAICNLKCVMCPLTSGLKRKKGVLKFENFKKVYDEINPPYLNLTGLGEPLINPDIFKIIQYARKKGSLIKLDTNATLLNEENIKNLLASDPTFISVSIDGITKKSYESIRVGANYEKVISNLKALIAYRNKMKSKSEIHLFFVLQKNNLKDFVNFIKFGDNLGLDAINGNIAISFGEARNENKIKLNKEDIKRIKSEFEQIKNKIKARLNIENIEDYLNNPENQASRMAKKPCFYPWYNPCITWDGYVVPCDIYCNNEIVFGNAFEEPFMKIWNNKKARKFRGDIIKQRRGICARCCVDESFIYDKLKPAYKMPLVRSFSHRK